MIRQAASPSGDQPWAVGALEPPPARPFPTPTPTGRRRKWPVVVLVLLVLAGAGAGGGLAWRRLTTKPLRVVPSLVHDTTAAATQALAPVHLELQVAQAYSVAVPNGQVVSQRPSPGHKLRDGSPVAVVVSLGPPPVTVPNLAGLDQHDATNRLIGAGFQVATVSTPYNTTVPKGQLISWSGEGGQLPQGSAVDLVVSNGPPVVAIPPLQGGTLAAAQAALVALGVHAAENDVYSTTVGKGQVVGTTPGSGTLVTVGSTITVNVSKGPHLVAVPDEAHQSVDAATAQLQAAGFNVAGVTGNPTANVVGTQPAAGASILFGSSVTLITS